MRYTITAKVVVASMALVFVAVLAVFIRHKLAPTHIDCRILNPQGSIDVLMLGNSLLHDFDWPLPDVQVINCAKQGQTLGEFMSRWQRMPPDIGQPDYIVIAFGTVEVVRSEQDARHIQEFVEVYPRFLAGLRQHWPSVELVVNLLPAINRDMFARPQLDVDVIEQLNRFIWQTTNCSGCRIIDVPATLTQGEASFDETLTYDGVHLTEHGYSKWSNALIGVISPR